MGILSGIIKNFLSGLFFALGVVVGGYILYKLAMHYFLGI